MRKIFGSFFLLLFVCFASAQTVRISHTYYTCWFSQQKHIPLVVTYTLTNKMLSCSLKVKRKSKFKPDPLHKNTTNVAIDYKKSGFDRGHNMPAGDNECNELGMQECFYFSNITPQSHAFNAGLWEELENLERKEAKKSTGVIVTCGSLGERTTIGIHKVVVPEKMWKVIYIPAEKRYQCYLFPNAEVVKGELKDYSVSLEQIRKLAGVEFKDGEVKPGF